MIDRHAEHQSMIRRVEQALKAISTLTDGRSKQAGLAKALHSVLDEAYERMTMAWYVLNDASLDVPKYHAYRSQKAAELSICYTTISNAYDELCLLNIINKKDRTEPTIHDMVIAAKEEERAANAARRQQRRSRARV